MRRPPTGVLVLGAVFAMALYSIAALDLELGRLARGWGNLGDLWARALPPDPSVWQIAVKGIIETLHIAFLGTLLGVLIGMPLALLASRNLFPWLPSAAARGLLAGIRVMPSLLWALLFVIVVGLGPLAGVLAMGIYTIGFFGKLQYEAIEALDPQPFDAMRAVGATRLQTVVHVAIPEAASALVSHIVFLFEYNLRHSTVIGLVGAGGIGYYLNGYLKFFQYDKVLVLLLVIFGVVLMTDALSRLIRKRLQTSRPPSTRRRSFARSLGAALVGAKRP